jgi:D-glycero-D-manno-heptose 1,7-bisphosphate phosphatase
MPKPMVPVNGRPFLEYLIEQIRAQGIHRILLLTGYRGEMIHEYFGTGKTLGVEVFYSHGPVEWDTGRRIWDAREHLDSRFLLLYSDNFVQFPVDRLMALHETERVSISLLLAPKAKGNIRVSAEGRIEAYDKTRTGQSLDFVEVGYMIVERDRVLNVFPTLKNHPDFSFSKVLQHLAGINQLAGLVVRDPYHSISDPDRLESMRSYLKSKKILLIDRDGVINQKAPRGEYISTWEGFKWIPETRQAMRELAAQGFKFIVITNQAGVARGMVSALELDRIHQSMISELHREGIEILGVYVCPHHWDDNCECRKPKPQMFFRISAEHLLRMDQTIFVGDDVRDREAAFNAGCGSLLIGPTEQYESVGKKLKWTMDTRRLSDAVPAIESFFRSFCL